jgi:hypothetical protein
MAIGPGDSSLTVTPGIVLSAAHKTMLARGELVIFVYGEIRYRDAFKHRRWTRYRLMMGGPVGLRGDQLAGCAEGIEAN